MSGMPNGGVGSRAPAKPLFKQIDPEIGTIQASKGTEQRRPVLSSPKRGRLRLVRGTKKENRGWDGQCPPWRSERCG